MPRYSEKDQDKVQRRLRSEIMKKSGYEFTGQATGGSQMNPLISDKEMTAIRRNRNAQAHANCAKRLEAKKGSGIVSPGFGEGMLIYIAGPMTGIAEHNYPAFEAAKQILENEGWKVLTTANCLPTGLDEDFYMRIAVCFVMEVDAIYMLIGWQESEGERSLADKLGIEIIYQEEH